jgi:peptidoglycan/LPS O-acetylase OafA/YrhL
MLVLALIANACFLPDHFDLAQKTNKLFPFNPPSWSLMLEVGVNVLFRTIFPWLKNLILLSVILLSAEILAASIFFAGGADTGWRPGNFLIGIPRVFFSFFLGVGLYRFSKCRPIRISNNIFSAAALAIFLVCVMAIDPGSHSRTIYDLVVITLVFPSIIYFAAHIEPKSKGAARIFAILGATSYAVYVLHLPLFRLVIGQIDILKAFRHVHHGTDISSGLCVIALSISCYFIDKYFDRPIRKLLNAAMADKSKQNDEISVALS